MLGLAVINFIVTIGSFHSASCYTVDSASDRKTQADVDNNIDSDMGNDINPVLDSNVELRIIDRYGDDEEESDLRSMQIIFPGTKWCGTGNVAADDNDFGIFEAADRCCYAHDHCPDYIDAGQSKHGLTNDAVYSRLLCDCDQQFYDCLKQNNRLVSNQIGFTYFNAITTKCFKEDYPIIRCHTYSSFIHKRCRVYELDNSKAKDWQWFDLPIY